MFCDETKIKLTAGNGGDGFVGYRREKFVSRGGPDGGDGGNGGNIILKVDENIDSLQNLHRIKSFKAEDGKSGGRQLMNGRTGADLILTIPPGTQVYDEKKENILADLVNSNDQFVITRGGRGGYGNAHFKTSVRQTPDFAELGERGEEKIVILELKLIADVGIIGLPSAGKSTLISKISSAKPKIADYHFTTLVPNLGVVYLSQFIKKDSGSLVVADIPGLIEGASEGKGLGIQFLKHIQRTRIIIHLIDTFYDNLYEDYETVIKELGSFSKDLLNKPQFIVFNKIDLLSKEVLKEKEQEFSKHLSNQSIYKISSISGEGIKELILDVYNDLKKIKSKLECLPEKPIKSEEEYKVFRPAEEGNDNYVVTLKGSKIKTVDGKAIRYKRFKVTGKRIEQIVEMTDFNNQTAVSRVYDVLQKMGIYNELHNQGASNGDIISISNKKIKYIEL